MAKIKYKKGTVTVYTKKDLASALESGQERVIVKGKIAKAAIRDMNGGSTVKTVVGTGSMLGSALACLVNPLIGIPATLLSVSASSGVLKDASLLEKYMVEKVESNEEIMLELKPEVKEKLEKKLKKSETGVTKALDKLRL